MSPKVLGVMRPGFLLVRFLPYISCSGAVFGFSDLGFRV